MFGRTQATFGRTHIVKALVVTLLILLFSMPVAHAQVNVISNGGFESWNPRTVTYATGCPGVSGTATSTNALLPDNWNPVSVFSFFCDLTIEGIKRILGASPGTFALRLGGTRFGFPAEPGRHTGYALVQDLPASPGDVYDLQYFGRGSNRPDAFSARIIVFFLRADKTEIPGGRADVAIPEGFGSLAYVSLQGTTGAAPAETVFVRTLLSKASFGFADFDDISLRLRNGPPIANAGPDQTVECTSPAGASLALDGGGSFDPDNDPLTFGWTWAGAASGSATITATAVQLPLGLTTFTLVVNDGKVDSPADSAVITVEDTTAPSVTAALVPVLDDDEGDGDDEDDERLFTVVLAARDVCDPNPTVTSILNDIPVVNGQIVELEFDDDVEVEIEHGLLGIEAPAFILTVTATDAEGNEASATATLRPPLEDDGDDHEDDDEDGDEDEDDRRRRRDD